jgi:hypothetical protein
MYFPQREQLIVNFSNIPIKTDLGIYYYLFITISPQTFFFPIPYNLENITSNSHCSFTFCSTTIIDLSWFTGFTHNIDLKDCKRPECSPKLLMAIEKKWNGRAVHQNNIFGFIQ